MNQAGFLTLTPRTPIASSFHTTGGKDPVSEAFQSGLALLPGLERRLGDALRHVLARPGSLVRARLAYGVSRRYNLTEERAVHIAIAIEFFHTASLLFDDLPVMDDAEERRGEPCTHRVFGEGAAILAALALVNRAYALLWTAMEGASPETRSLAMGHAERCLGVEGILDGQSRDLHARFEKPTLSDALRVSVGKTVSLIRLTLVLPAVLGDAPAKDVFFLKRLAVYWGLAYQMLDDVKDVCLTSEVSGKTTRRDALLSRPNAALAAGLSRTRTLLARLIEQSNLVVRTLTAQSADWTFLEVVQSRFQHELVAPLALANRICA